MAINYTNLFSTLGEVVQRINNWRAYYADLDTDLSEMQSDFQSAGRQDLLEGTFPTFESYKGDLLRWIGGMTSKGLEILLHRVTVLEQLRLDGDTSFQRVHTELFADMVANSQDVLNSTVTIGSVTDVVRANAASGTVVTGKVLDGVSPPHTVFNACRHYNGLVSELAGTTDLISVTCITDQDSDGVTEGSEQFQVSGNVTQDSPYGWQTYGSGSGPAIQPIQAESILDGFEFESFTTNVPDSWTLDAGVAGTHVFSDNAAPQRGSFNLKLTGDAALASIQISQAPETTTWQPRRRYAFGFWVKGQAGTSAGTLYIGFTGTGYTAASTEKIEMNAAALAAATTWTWKQAYINIPDEVPDDFEFVIRWNGTPSAHSVRVDGGGIAPVHYFNGIHLFIYAGNEAFVKGDRFTFTVVNDNAGVFSTYFRLAYGVQVPTDAAPAIADSLAT